MEERRREAERVEGGDSVSEPKEDDVNQVEIHRLEGEGSREGVDKWRGQVAVDDSDKEDEEEEEDSESATDIYYQDDDEDESDLKTDSAYAGNAIALAAQKSSESRPNFGNIVVNSSSDVHFGNKTFYNGPVTIKQFVYTARNGSVDAHLSENGDKDGDSRVGVDEEVDPVPSGLPNGKVKVQCPTPASANVISVPSAHTLTSEPSPEVNGSLLPIWQPSRSEYHIS